MRKLLAALLFALPSLVAAQVTDWQTWPVSWRRWDAGTVLTLGYTTIQNDAVAITQRSIINVIGGGCVDNAGTASSDCTFSGGGGGAPTDATYITQTANGSLSAEQALSSLSTGIMRVATTTGVVTSLTDSAGIAANVSDESGSGALVFGTGPTITNGDVVDTDTVWDAAGDLVVGTGSNTAAKVTIGAANTILTSNGTTAGWSSSSYPGMARTPTTFVLWDDMCGRPANALAAVFASVGTFSEVGAGTSAGGIAPTFTSDGTSPCYIELSTGTTSTGQVSLIGGPALTGNQDTFSMAGGEIAEFRFALKTIADLTTNKTQVTAGFCDSTSGIGCDDAAYVYFVYDGTATNWGCHAEAGGSITDSVSSTAATAAAWHTARVQFNAAGTSVQYFVDGAELSCSPIATGNVPSGNTEQTAPMIKYSATAGCGTATICVLDVDYGYVYKPNVSR